MTCATCGPIAEKTNVSVPHVIRVCAQCGDDYPVLEPGEHGIGIKVNKGDRFVIPTEYIKIAANPLKATGQLTHSGIEWFAELMFGVEIAKAEARNDFLPTLEKIQDANEALFLSSPILQGLDMTKEADQLEASHRLENHQKSVEWWGFTAAVLNAHATNAIKNQDASAAAWAMAASERFRALAIFKEHFSEVVFMGHSAGRLLALIREWDANKANGDEGFWQIILGSNTFAFSQLFAAPVTFIQGKAYVGGTQLDGKDARFLDFMLSGGNANHAILVEIKTPTTKLLGRKYRGNAYSPSRELSGSVVQVNDYCNSLRNNIESITKENGLELNTFNPRRIVLIGNYTDELDDQKKRSSFELFRSSLSGVEIVTFDEFFTKVERLAELFGLARKT